MWLGCVAHFSGGLGIQSLDDRVFLLGPVQYRIEVNKVLRQNLSRIPNNASGNDPFKMLTQNNLALNNNNNNSYDNTLVSE